MGIKFQVMDAKPVLKETLQAEVGLPVDRNIPIICFVGRLEEQKGPDILVAAVEQFIDEDFQIIILVSVETKMVSSDVVPLNGKSLTDFSLLGYF